jgi:hypothetical protein
VHIEKDLRTAEDIEMEGGGTPSYRLSCRIWIALLIATNSGLTRVGLGTHMCRYGRVESLLS